MNATIRQLPSGYWAIWIGQTWIDAASITAAQAVRKAISEYKCTAAYIDANSVENDNLYLVIV